jgi:hypothetical protein
MKKMACRDCAVKHVRSAYAYAAYGTDDGREVLTGDTALGFVSQAYVLASEAPFYPDHYDMAVGMLVRAEEEAAMADAGAAARIREIRISTTDAAELSAALADFPLCDRMPGHLREAVREGGLPPLPASVGKRWVVENLEALIESADAAEAARRAAGSGEPGKGGEGDMVKNKKKVAAKACDKKGCKAAKACDKGGKAKK